MTGNSETGNIDETSARALIRELILELAPNRGVTALAPTLRLVEDLEYHSLALMELAFTLEDEFHLDPIDEADVQKIVSVGDVEQHVINELQQKCGLLGSAGNEEH